MKICLTGVSGFLGSHLRKAGLDRGYDIFEISFRTNCKDKFFDELKNTLINQKIDLFINAGASQNTKDDPTSIEELLISNVYLPSTIAYCLRKFSPDTIMINFGSSWQLGEDGSFSPFNAYAATKTAAEAMLEHYALDGIRCASLRLYDTYGPADERNKIINLIADALIERSDLPMSGGEQQIDFIYIDDVINGVFEVANDLSNQKSGCHLIYSIRSAEIITVNQLVKIMKEEIGLNYTPFIRPGVYPYRNRERFALFSGGKSPPNWLPKVSIREGVKKIFRDRTKIMQK